MKEFKEKVPMIKMIEEVDINDYVGDYKIKSAGKVAVFDETAFIMFDKFSDEVAQVRNEAIANRANGILAHDSTKEFLKIFRKVKNFIYDVSFEIRFAEHPDLHAASIYAICDMLTNNKNLAVAIRRAAIDNIENYKDVTVDSFHMKSLPSFEMEILAGYISLLSLFMSPYKNFNKVIRSNVYLYITGTLYISNAIIDEVIRTKNELIIDEVYKSLATCTLGRSPYIFAYVVLKESSRYNDKIKSK